MVKAWHRSSSASTPASRSAGSGGYSFNLRACRNQQDKVDSKDSLLQEAGTTTVGLSLFSTGCYCQLQVTKLAGKLPGDSDVLEKTQVRNLA